MFITIRTSYKDLKDENKQSFMQNKIKAKQHINFNFTIKTKQLGK
jgi:hypothetical protein